MCQASLAVAQAAAELAAGSETAEIPSVSVSLTGSQLEELEHLKRTVTSQQEELDVLRNLNAELENEMEVMVSKMTRKLQ